MRALLEQAEEMNRTDQLFTSDSIGQALVHYYDHWWQPVDLRMRAYYMLGCAYRDEGNAPRALEYYQRAVDLIDTTSAPDSTLNRLMRVHSQRSRIYLLQRLPELEEQELQTAERLAWKTGDTLSALFFEEYLCNISYQKGDYMTCIQKAEELQKKYQNYHFENEAKLACIYFVRAYIALGDYTNAKKYLDIYESSSYIHSMPQNVIGGLFSLYIYKGKYHQGIGNTDSAEFYFRKATFSPDNEIRLLAYKGLCQSKTILQIPDSIYKYIHLYAKAKEKSFDDGQSQASIQAKSLYDYSIEQKIARQKAIRVSQLEKIIAVLFLAILTGTSYFIRIRKKRKEELIKLFQRHQTIIQELTETEEELSLVKEKRNKDTQVISTLQATITQKEVEILSLEKAIHQKDPKAKGIKIQETDIVKHIVSLRMQGKRLSPEDCKILSETVEKIYPTFYIYLNTRQRLNAKEYLVCLLVVSGFSPSDIEVLMNSSSSFSSMIRRRLCVKVFGIEGKPSEFDRLLRKIF